MASFLLTVLMLFMVLGIGAFDVLRRLGFL